MDSGSHEFNPFEYFESNETQHIVDNTSRALTCQSASPPMEKKRKQKS